ncbi:hypothetical protein M2152_002592 [Microbacteriaceae bacterium SG_E_30_P1]|uniref:Uncharacterized protein n=1 Tax=Antiquaquibacter oligotrophicus TaxID=2880260 RepID=A0ABT6KRJ9_9MICO|nr:hypothetical protein [Antiquaquibacter oligotrophicus]MDH6182410.1 hypothetical protein [Antiquaquibacter oligotrophicus]UDF14618.1 hypothetical protein LH407_07085 [Antiquaquibacter oligotrophicus]
MSIPNGIPDDRPAREGVEELPEADFIEQSRPEVEQDLDPEAPADTEPQGDIDTSEANEADVLEQQRDVDINDDYRNEL